jgi:hypothetical protein
MATAYTSLLGLALPVTGELSGTWGDTVNNSITSLLDSAVAGTTTLSSDADVTLSTTTGAANTAREAILLWTAGGTVTRNITAPAQSKVYIVINASSSTQSIVLRGVGPTTGVTILKGEVAVCAWNGSDFVKSANIGAATFTSVTDSGLTSGRVTYSSTGGLLVDSANLTYNGATLTTVGTSAASAFKTPNITEVDTISATAATGTINFDITTQSVLYYTSNASGNWTLNFRGSSGTTLNAVMATGESLSATFLVTNGSTAYYNSAVTIDGTSVTPKWQGGSAPTSGNASSTDCYTYVIQKTGSATYVVLASQTKFA